MSGASGQGGYGNGGRGGAGPGRGRGNSGGGRGGGRNFRPPGGFPNVNIRPQGGFFHGESSGGGADGGNPQWMNRPNPRGNFASNPRTNAAAHYGGNQTRQGQGLQNNYRGGNYGYRSNYNNNASYRQPADVSPTPVDQTFVQKTVEAVVAAITAAQKVSDGVPAAGPGGIVAAGEVGTSAVKAASSSAVNQQQRTAQGVLAAADVRSGKEADSAGAAKKKKEDKATCFKCKKPGHFIDDCPVESCVYCESIHHASGACNLLQAPKPVVTMNGYANEGLMFFELPTTGAFKSKVDNPKLAKVTVEGETLTIPEIIEYLRRIIPYDNFHWEVYHYRNNIYRVKFPSKFEVQRMKNFGVYQCVNKASDLVFDFWSNVEEPLYMLPEVWVQVSGIPADIRGDFLTLWGIGSLFGKTLEVDMAYTRKNKVLRIKIGCTDSSLIPTSMDIFIRRGFFKLDFEVEAVMVTEDAAMADVNNGTSGGDDDSAAHKDTGSDMDLDPNGKMDPTDQSKNSSNPTGDEVQGGNRQVMEGLKLLEIRFGAFSTQVMVQNEVQVASVQLKPLGDHIAYEGPRDSSLLGDDACPNASSLASSDQMQDVILSPAAAHCLAHSDSVLRTPVTANIERPAVVVSPKGAGKITALPRDDVVGVRQADDASMGTSNNFFNSSSPLMADISSCSLCPDISSGVADVTLAVEGKDVFSPGPASSVRRGFCSPNAAMQGSGPTNDVTPMVINNGSSGGPTMEEVAAFGGIPDPALPGIRSSERISKQPNGDATLLERAMLNKQGRLDYTNAGMVSSNFSLLSFSNSEISEKAKRIGISLGKSVHEVNTSIHKLKSLEEERFLTVLQNKNNNNNFFPTDDGPSSLIMSKVSTLCEDLVDEEENLSALDDQLDIPMPNLKEKKTRRRKVYDSSNIRRSNRKITKKVF
jgi:hypothetical protein